MRMRGWSGRAEGGAGATTTWHATKVKREDADARGIEWGEGEGVRKRTPRGVAGT